MVDDLALQNDAHLKVVLLKLRGSVNFYRRSGDLFSSSRKKSRRKKGKPRLETNTSKRSILSCIKKDKGV